MEHKTKFLYRSTFMDKLILLTLVGYMWLGTVFNWDSFSNSVNARLISSSAMAYLIWHFFASRKLLFIQITSEGVCVPNTWLPGLVTHQVPWSQIREIDTSWREGLSRIRIKRKNFFPLHIYKKCVRVHGMKMISSSDASVKLMEEHRIAWRENS